MHRGNLANKAVTAPPEYFTLKYRGHEWPDIPVGLRRLSGDDARVEEWVEDNVVPHEWPLFYAGWGRRNDDDIC